MRGVGIATITILSVATIGASFCAPHVLAKNEFLRNFVNHELLNILAVIVTITLASISHLHLAFNKIEEDAQREVLQEARKEIRDSAYWLIGLLLGTIVLLIVRSNVLEIEGLVSFFNGLAVIILVLNILILLDIVCTTLVLGPKLPPRS